MFTEKPEAKLSKSEPQTETLMEEDNYIDTAVKKALDSGWVNPAQKDF